jgi:hypothetical protein
MSNLHLFLVVVGMCIFGTLMALTLTAIIERKEDGDA